MKVDQLGKPLTTLCMPGQVRLPDGREAYVTRTGLVIGIRHVPRAPAQQPGRHAEIVQGVLLHRRPLVWDQMLVRAICKVNQ